MLSHISFTKVIDVKDITEISVYNIKFVRIN